jgi:hypothetical protein
MSLSIDKRWITIRVEDDDARATLHAMATNGDKTATGVLSVELAAADIKLLRGIINDNMEAIDQEAMGNLMESIRIDQNAAPPKGVKTIKVGGGLGMSGDAARRKTK